MSGLAELAAFVGAVAYLASAPLEMFFYGRPGVRRFLHVRTSSVDDVRLWAFAVGFRNMLAGLGTLVGLLILHVGAELVGRAVVLTASWYMLLASLAMVLSDALGYWHPRGGSIRGTVGSSLLPLVVLIASGIG